MANPTPIYTVTYGGEQLPGYVQSDDRPLSFNRVISKPFGRDGATVNVISADLREISITFLVKSRLGSNSSGIQHLDDCMNQYRDALAILTRSYTEQNLQIHDSDRRYLASIADVSMPMSAGKSRSMLYTVKFVAQPWALASLAVSDSIGGNGTLSLAIGTESRRTYPKITIDSGVLEFTAVDPNGKTIEFERGSQAGALVVDCAKLITFRQSNGQNASATMLNVNYGMYYDDGTGTYEIDVTGYVGSGDITVDMWARYEL